MNLTLERFAYTPMGTFGRLTYSGGSCYTMEEVWRNNEKGMSCIPVGTYRVQRGKFPKHGECFEVQGVPGRSAILFHVANTIKDVEGCIGPGQELGTVGGLWAVLNSVAAYNDFMKAHAGQDVLTLRIQNLDGGKL